MTKTENGILRRLGLHRRELRAWALYDWANSAFVLVVITTVFPIFYRKLAQGGGLSNDDASKFLGYATTAAMVIVALTSPVLGAIADFLGRRKRFLAISVLVGSLATTGFFFISSGGWLAALTLFAIGNACLFLSFVFYDSLLPHLASEEEMDRVSTAGYAIGYLGSGLLLVGILAMIQKPHWFGLQDAGLATRTGFITVALWWAAFTLPLLRRVPEPPRQIEKDETDARSAVRVALTRLRETFHELRHGYRHAFLMLAAFMVYNEGIGTVIRMGAIYAVSLGFPESTTIISILMIQFLGVPFAFLFGMLGPRIGIKRAILLGLAIYTVISLLAFQMTRVHEFYLIAFLVALAQGGTQGLSRSLFGSLTPKHKTSEFFGFFSVFAKVAGIFGPLFFALVIEVTGSQRAGILGVIVFFVVGALVLLRVDVEAGRRQAKAADARLINV
jgi:UMF1 family MFS transporter